MAIHGNSRSLTLPIPSDSLDFARQVARHYELRSLRQRVFLNAIAVVTVHHFLEMMGVHSEYGDSDLNQPVVQLAADSSDLEVVNLGALECRWMPKDASFLTVPYEGWGDRLGYAFVSVDLDALQATIEGFLPQIEFDQIPLAQLRSVEFMLQHLNALMLQRGENPRISLTQWLAGQVSQGWQTVESLLNQPNGQLSYGFRGVELPRPTGVPLNLNSTHGGLACRAKVLDWQPCDPASSALESKPESVVLVVEICQIDPLIANVLVQMHPSSETQYLPPKLELSILDSQNNELLKAISRSIDTCLQLPLKGEPGEEFQVNLSLGSYGIVEYFQV